MFRFRVPPFALAAALSLVAAVGMPLAGIPAFTNATPATSSQPIPIDAIVATVVGVADGDTIRVELDGLEESVRLILIDTPETRDPRRPVECFGREATARIKALLPEGQTVYLERDVTDRDRYGRLLRYVWVPDGEAGLGFLLNERLVREGYAALYTYPPDVGYVERIRAAQQAAVEEGAGLWAACGGTDTPLDTLTPPSRSDTAAGSGSAITVTPGGGDRDCSDFTTHAAAQAFFVAAGGSAADPHRLDGDGDGIACEIFP